MIKVCSRCVMDSSIKDLTFSRNGYCSYCQDFFNRYSFQENKNIEEIKLEKLNKFLKEAKAIGKGKKYDCIVGISGGVDSAWTLVEVVKKGLRPLAVHMDNGWNSELAQSNISNIVSKLGVDLYTHVIEWNEYKNLMESFFKSNVVDIEILYDNAFLALLYQQAHKYGLRHLVAGTNSSTEGMRMPKDWNWFKLDKTNIKDIASKNNVRIKTMPIIGVKFWFYCEYIKRIRWISFPEFFSYKKDEATKMLIKEYSYKPYPYKHYESIFTRFYQGYILPNKFNIDKRKLHLSNLVVTSQMNRKDALKELEGIPYNSEKELNEDLEYFLKKMNWSQKDLEVYINKPRSEHFHYKSEKWLFEFLNTKIKNLIPNKLKSFLRNSYTIR